MFRCSVVISECGVENLTVTGWMEDGGVGGLVGYKYNGLIEKSYVAANVTVDGSYYVGGFIGKVWGGVIRDSYSHATVSALGDYYNYISDDNIVDNSKEIKKVTNNDVSLSFNGTNIENKKVTYVMRHKVKKKLYKITVGDKSVTVTEDHSVIVLDDNNNMLSIKPKDMDNTKHRIIKIIKDIK